MSDGKEPKCVSWTVFVWVVAIVTAVLGILFAIQISLMDNISQIKADVSSIRTDIAWIKTSLNKDVAIFK